MSRSLSVSSSSIDPNCRHGHHHRRRHRHRNYGIFFLFLKVISNFVKSNYSRSLVFYYLAIVSCCFRCRFSSYYFGIEVEVIIPFVAAVEEVKVIFRNELPYDVDLYWEGNDGRRVPQQESILVGYQKRVFTRPGHVFSYDDDLGQRYYLTIPDDGRTTMVLLIDGKTEDEKCLPEQQDILQNNNNHNNNDEQSNGDDEMMTDILIFICTQSFTGEELVEDVLYDRLLENNWRVKATLVDEAGIDWTESSFLQQQQQQPQGNSKGNSMDGSGSNGSSSGATGLSLIPYARVVLVVASTYGDGDPPNHATEFADWLTRGRMMTTTTTYSSSSASLDSFATSPPFAVFGLGDSGYANFNSVGKFIDSSLAMRGGKRLLELHTGDALADQSGEFRKWTQQLIPILDNELFSADSSSGASSSSIIATENEYQKQHQQRAIFSSTGTDWRRSSIQPGSVIATLTNRQELLSRMENPKNQTNIDTRNVPQQKYQEQRSVVHVEFSLPTDFVMEGLQPGDHMGVYPRNSPVMVQRALDWLEIDGTMITKIMERDTINNKWMPKEITAFEFLSTHVDLSGRASPSALRALLSFAGTLELRALARELTFVQTKSTPPSSSSTTKTASPSSPSSSSSSSSSTSSSSSSFAFDHWVAGRWLTKMDLAIIFECRPSLQALARALGPMQPRLYSVATVDQRSSSSSILQQTTRVGLCVSVAEGGLCSNYMANDIQQNITPVAVFFRKSKFHFDSNDKDTPAFLVAAGSGIGPYIGFMENEMKKHHQESFNTMTMNTNNSTGSILVATKNNDSTSLSSSLSHIHVGFGCRTPSEILYNDRLQVFQNKFGAQMYFAFSRVFGQPKIYAQDLMEREMETVWNKVLSHRQDGRGRGRGRVYACGRLEVCEGVRDSIIKAAIQVGKLEEYEARQFVQDMEDQGRLLTDCWSVDPPNPLFLSQQQSYAQYTSQAIPRLERHRHHAHPTIAETMTATSSQKNHSSINTNTNDVDLSHIPAWPSYLRLVASGEFERRIEKATNMFSACVACGRFCEVDRLSNNPDDWGECRVGNRVIVSAADAHFGEEDCLVGTNGSGTIFFGACNLKCMYCQNWKLSMMDQGQLVDDERLAEYMLMLQNDKKCHNINLVSPTHNILPILRGIYIAAKRGLKLPIVFNTGGYDSVASLRLLDGIIDIYMPDSKYASRAVARKLSKIDNYPEINQAAIKEMHRQVGELQIDPRTGLAYRGVLVRHLVLPSDYGGSNDVTSFLANEVSKNTYTNINDYYRPEYDAKTDTKYGMNRKPTRAEKLEAHKAARRNCLQRLHWEKRLYPDGRPYPDSCTSCSSTTSITVPPPPSSSEATATSSGGDDVDEYGQCAA